MSPPTATLDAPTKPARAKSVGLRDVAKEAGVSVATVSMVLNDNPRISRATQAKVRREIDRLGYQPNRLAQSLSSQFTRVLGVILPDVRHAFADAYFGEVVSGVVDRAGRLGHKVMLEQAKPSFVAGRKHLELFERKYVDGVLLLGTNDHQAYLNDFASAGHPAVVVDNRIAGPDGRALDHVACDYASGAQQAMNYLAQLGHRRVGLIWAAPEIHTARVVRDAWARGVRQAGGSPDESLVADGRFTEEGGALAAAAILDREPGATALLAINDKMAIGAMHLLARRGVRVPAEVSVVGFDDLHHAAFVNPSLTTIHLPLHQVGALAAERLIDRVHGRRDAVAEVLPAHLVVRDSTAIARDVGRG